MIILKSSIILFLSLMSQHPVHISLTSIDYIDDSSSFQLFVKLFSDDLEDDCRLLFNDAGLILYDQEWNPDSLILKSYIGRRFLFEADGEILKGKINGIIADEEEVRVTLIYKAEGKPSMFRIVNTFMTELFEDQTNFMIFRIGEYEEGFMLDGCNTELIIKL